MKRINLVFLVFLISFIACTSDDNDGEGETNNERKKSECNVAEILAYPGTSCCITGFSEAKPGETLEYQFYTNMIDPTIEWSVVSGDISIVSGEDTSKVTVKFGDNFTEGRISILGENTIKGCGTYVDITKM